MEKLNCRSIILLTAEILWLLISVAAQPGFLNVNCGGNRSYTDSQTNLTWSTDDDYIDVGQTASVTNSTLPYHLQSLRFFPKPLNKSCYILPVNPNATYLIRLWFLFGNYNGIQQLPSFNYTLEMPGMLYKKTKSVTGQTPTSTREMILMASSEVLYVCLIRTSESSDPFLSGIQLRVLSSGMYEGRVKTGTMLISVLRYNTGADSADLVRYPQDEFDRFWQSDMVLKYDDRLVRKARSNATVFRTENNKTNYPPAAVMQTAVIVRNVQNRLPFSLDTQDTKTLIVLYFAEVEALNASLSRNFKAYVNDHMVASVNFPQKKYSIEVSVPYNDTLLPSAVVSLQSVEPNDTYGRGPLINAFEYYKIVNSEPETFASDVCAILFIKKDFNMKNWISDPCFAIEWDGIRCNQSSPVGAVRVWELDLSGRGLYGSVPSRINELTELRNISLHDNNLSGALPDLCSLTKLEILRLQNNNLSGHIPDCLSELNNLRELNVENNSFSGVIPEKLLRNGVLKFSYSGNPHLCQNKQKCGNNNKKKKLAIVLGSAIGAILTISLASFIVGRRRQSKKRAAGLSVKVQNPTKNCSFSPEEMTIATHNFSQEIGHGGFGMVYFGNLLDGRDVAVKVLSSSSKQGVVEFLNEIDLLSRTHHKNLVSLVDYCNDFKQLMLVYEHMPGGSLKDHLYGSMANSTKLDWKSRLLVALDAAEGLEYLHVSCTPKIIHRDVKSSNILLDSKMRAKVSDFGLSRIIGDDMATHVTTNVKGTVGYLDPEYFDTNKLTERSDVYSFGVVLLEIICGRKPIDENFPEEELNIVKWVKLHVQSNENSRPQVTHIIDKRLQMSDDDLKAFHLIVDLSMRCVDSDGSKRPTISEIVNSLKEAIVMMGLEDSTKESAESSHSVEISCSILQEGR